MLKAQFDRIRGTRAGIVAGEVGNFVAFAVRRFFTDRLNNAAASLTYSTLLALVPLLVIAFAILSSFRAFDAVKDRMRDLFFNAVVPEAGAAVESYLSGFTENASDLTAAGVVALAVAAVLLLSTIEDTLNQVWHVERPRPILVRFLIFWAILTLGPMLIAASIALSSDIADYARNAALFEIGVPAEVGARGSSILGGALSVLISVVGFTALFVLVPARQVRIRHALIGATFAALAFELLSWGFNTFYASGSSYQTIYGAVAAVPVFLIWVYTSWMVIILGAVLAAAFPEWWQARSATLGVELRPPARLELALEFLARLHARAQEGGTIEEAELLDGTPYGARDAILESLTTAGFAVETDEGQLALSRDLNTATLRHVVQALDLSLGQSANDDLPVALREGFVLDADAFNRVLGQLDAAERDVLDMPVAALTRGSIAAEVARAAE